jgi:3-methyladenine DNA glycosylase AlkD
VISRRCCANHKISIYLVGAILEKDKKAFEYLIRWSGDGNFWMRRAALISQLLLLRAGRGDKRLFFSFAKKMLGEKEFFIRKAIGWCLREMSKGDRKSAFEFIKDNKGEMSKLTFKEGSRNLPKELQEKL